MNIDRLSTVAFVLFAIGIAAAQDSPSRTSQQQITGSVERAQKEFARLLAYRVQRAYENLSYLRIEGTVLAPPLKEVHFMSEMTETEYKTVVRVVEDGKEKLLFVTSLEDGRITELRPEWEYREGFVVKNVKIEYDAPQETGTSDPVVTTDIPEYGCLVGSYHHTWIGKVRNSFSPNFPKIRTQDGTMLPDGEVGGKPCYVLMWELADVADYQRRDILYIDKDTHLWRKWDTLVAENGSPLALERSRIILKIETQPGTSPAEAHTREIAGDH